MLTIKVFDVAYDQTTKKFDDSEMRHFMHYYGDKILDMRRDFFMLNNMPHYSVFITYEQKQQSQKITKEEIEEKRVSNVPDSIQVNSPSQAKVKKEEQSYKNRMDKEEKKLDKHLRHWRLMSARKDNMPAFVYFNNKQMYSIIEFKPSTLEELRELKGFGVKKVDKYGNDILRIIREHFGEKP